MHSINSVQRTILDGAVLLALVAPLVRPDSGAVLTVTRVPVLAGHDADLPCDVQPPIKNDSLLLLAWYKEDKPIYSYDSRVLGPAAHWVADEYVGRMYWRETSSPGLQVQNFQAQDRAAYSCRVDFHVSQTRNYKISLDVIELPAVPLIHDNRSNEVQNKAGPYYEGGSFTLVCTVKGGYPPPIIQWFRGNTTLKSLKPADDEETTKTRSLILEVNNLTREQDGSEYSCSAGNTVLAPPRRTSISIEMYLKPLTVKIILPNELLLGHKTEILCISTGSRPSADIFWWLGGKEMNVAGIIVTSEERNETKSIIQWSPVEEYNGQDLVCAAENPKYRGLGRIETKVTLDIYYAPKVVINFGEDVNANRIKEGDDVSFSCTVDANPPPFEILWEYNGKVIATNSSAMNASASVFTLRAVSWRQAGLYSCAASNAYGNGSSPRLEINITHTPICRKKGSNAITAALRESTTLVCEVDAFPPANTFVWTLNSSASLMTFDNEYVTVETDKGRSVLTYTPTANTDYGTVECRAVNDAGQQEAPCSYTIRPTSKPDAPENCTVYNLTHNSLDLYCDAGYDGGLQPIYIAEVWSKEGLVINASNEIPLWNLRRLGDERHLRLIIYAANAIGNSKYVTLTTTTKMFLEVESQNDREWELSWIMGLFLGVTVTIAIIVCLGLTATSYHNRSRDYEVNIATQKNSDAVTPLPISEEKSSGIELFIKGTPACTLPRLNIPAFSMPHAAAPTRISDTYNYYNDSQNSVRFSSPHGRIYAVPMATLRESVV